MLPGTYMYDMLSYGFLTYPRGHMAPGSPFWTSGSRKVVNVNVNATLNVNVNVNVTLNVRAESCRIFSHTSEGGNMQNFSPYQL